MADVIEPLDVEGARRDLADTKAAVNEKRVIVPRSGLSFESLPLAIQKVLETGGFEPFATEALLLASVPTLTKKAAKALDTKKIWLWESGTWKDTGLSELDQAIKNTSNQILTEKPNLFEFSIKSTKGGQYLYATTSAYIENGYINNVGTFVASAAGYKTTDFIAIASTDTIKSIASASASVAQLAFYDKNKTLISVFVGNSSISERTTQVPANAKFIKACNHSTMLTNPSVYAIFQDLLSDPSLIKQSSLELEHSKNLADKNLIINDAYVNNTGSITSAAGWKYIKIPVVAGTTYTFGNFAIDSGGYSAFYDADSKYISGSVSNFNNGLLPRTVTAPAGAAYLLIDIARPTNTALQHSELTVNEGMTLIDYVDATPTITKIAGYSIAGTGGGGGSEPTPIPENVVLQGADATLADVIADSITTGALIANLPTSSVGLEIGQAYIDNGTIKVVM